MELMPFAIMSNVFNLPVILIIWTRDNRKYQTSFQLQSSLDDGQHYLMLQMADLNREVNRLRLFIDCQLIGEESTEVPIRNALLGRITVVKYCLELKV